MSFKWSLQKSLIISTIISTIYVTEAHQKLSYRDPLLDEQEATLVWTEILSNPLTPNDVILNAIKQGKDGDSFGYR